MKKGILTSLGLAAVLTLGLASVNEYREVKEVNAAETYEKATSIAVGDTVVLVCESKTMELNGISTTSTKYGLGVAYTNSPAGAYSLKVEAGTASETYAFKTSDDKYLYWSSGNSLATNASLTANTSWSVTFNDGGNAIIKNGKDASRQLQWNASSPRFACYTGSQTAVQLYKLNENGGSTEPEVPEEPEFVDGTDEVKSLFNKYYNGGAYIKKTVLNVNEIAQNEVAKYFHASADTRYRKTEYTSESLTMTTSTDGLNYDESKYSKYENAEKDGVKYVKHTGTVGGDYSYYAKETVDDWFVTLSDFKDYNYVANDWKKDASGVYTYNLTATTATSEHDMTEMAREFVAPMWLAPNANNWSYAKFDKLTVQELFGKLIMKLYTTSTNSGILLADSNLVFSEATISLPKPENFEPVTVTTKIADYATANNWSTGTKYNTVNMDGIVTVKAEHTKIVSGQTYTGSYYTSNPTGWRIYQSDAGKVTVSVAEGYELVSVKITYTVKNTGVLTLNGSNITSSTMVNASGSSIVFNTGNTGTATNGQVGISAIEVTYK